VVAKQVADLVTITRGLLVFVFPWLGLVQGKSALTWVGLLLLVDWTGDSLDGPLARHSRSRYQTWIGDHDLEVDMAVSLGLLFYMLLSGFVDLTIGIAYLLLSGLFFWRFGIPRSMGMLFQAPIYGWFLFLTVREIPTVGWWMVGWILAAMVITWPKFPKEMVPDFLGGLKKIFPEDHRTDA
jgi:cardiolipin synthase